MKQVYNMMHGQKNIKMNEYGHITKTEYLIMTMLNTVMTSILYLSKNIT